MEISNTPKQVENHTKNVLDSLHVSADLRFQLVYDASKPNNGTSGFRIRHSWSRSSMVRPLHIKWKHCQCK